MSGLPIGYYLYFGCLLTVDDPMDCFKLVVHPDAEREVDDILNNSRPNERKDLGKAWCAVEDRTKYGVDGIVPLEKLSRTVWLYELVPGGILLEHSIDWQSKELTVLAVRKFGTGFDVTQARDFAKTRI